MALLVGIFAIVYADPHSIPVTLVPPWTATVAYLSLYPLGKINHGGGAHKSAIWHKMHGVSVG